MNDVPNDKAWLGNRGTLFELTNGITDLVHQIYILVHKKCYHHGYVLYSRKSPYNQYIYADTRRPYSIER